MSVTTTITSMCSPHTIRVLHFCRFFLLLTTDVLALALLFVSAAGLEVWPPASTAAVLLCVAGLSGSGPCRLSFTC